MDRQGGLEPSSGHVSDSNQQSTPQERPSLFDFGSSRSALDGEPPPGSESASYPLDDSRGTNLADVAASPEHTGQCCLPAPRGPALSASFSTDDRGEQSGRTAGSGSRVFRSVGSFVAGLQGYGSNLTPRRRSEKDREGMLDTALCQECHTPLDSVSMECPGCNDLDARVPPLPPPAPPSIGDTKKGEKGTQMGCLLQSKARRDAKESSTWIFGRVLDPRGHGMKYWTRCFFITAALSLFIDPSYMYAFSFTLTSSCLYVQAGFALALTIAAALCTLAYVVQSYLSFRTAFMSRESVFLGRGELVFDACAIARHHFFSIFGFPLDILVIIPVPQILVYVVTPSILRSVEGDELQQARLTGLLFLLVMLQYALKAIHMFLLAIRVQRVNGYVFGTVWWGFVLNFVIFILTAHALGGLWYLEAVNTAMNCTFTQCDADEACQNSWMVCNNFLSFSVPGATSEEAAWGEPGTNVSSICFTTESQSWDYGIYSYGVQLLQDSVVPEKIMYGIFFGMMSMATFGNALVPSPDLGQAVFAFVFVLFGLLLFTTLIGNIGVFLSSTTARVDEMRMRRSNLDWWMRRRQLPAKLQTRVRQQERLRFVATKGMDEDALLEDLPISLKREVKRHLCGDLVRSVPLFRSLDDLVVDSICVRLRPCVLIHGTELVRQGEPVQEMLFIVKGRIKSTHTMPSGAVSTCDIGPGSFCGEELLTWSLSRTPNQDHLPAATATLAAGSVLEMFSLSAEDLQFITSHYRFHLRERKLRQLIKYYSPHWRTWAAVTIQLWWRRYKEREMRSVGPKPPLDDALDRIATLQMYSALLQTPKPAESIRE